MLRQSRALFCLSALQTYQNDASRGLGRERLSCLASHAQTGTEGTRTLPMLTQLLAEELLVQLQLLSCGSFYSIYEIIFSYPLSLIVIIS